MTEKNLLLYKRSAEFMSEISDGTVALTVTSPPYWNAIDYDLHSQHGDNAWYRTRNYSIGFEGYEEYLDFLGRVYREIFRATKSGGFVCTVIGTILHNKRHIPVPFHFSEILEEIGWEFHQDIIWHKCTGGVKRAGSVIQRKLPGYFYPNIMTEYILVFRKPGEPIYRAPDEETRAKSEFEINKLFVNDTANNIWHIAPVPPKTINHPCPFPEEIPLRLISLYSFAGDVVLDPFAGSGQTLKVAMAMDRKAIGYDIQAKYIKMTEKRVGEPLAIRPEQLIAQFQKIDINAPLDNKYSSRNNDKSRKNQRKQQEQSYLLFRER